MNSQENLQPQKVQHELSPEMEQKLIGLARKGFKIWVIYISIVFVIIIVGGTLFYFVWFKPIFERTMAGQQNFDKKVEEFNNMREEDKQMLEQRKQDFQKEFEQEKQKTQEEFNRTLVTPTP